MEERIGGNSKTTQLSVIMERTCLFPLRFTQIQFKCFVNNQNLEFYTLLLSSSAERWAWKDNTHQKSIPLLWKKTHKPSTTGSLQHCICQEVRLNRQCWQIIVDNYCQTAPISTPHCISVAPLLRLPPHRL